MGRGFAERLNGMYAFAIWDPREEELLLVRDRMGIKPLYYYPTPDGVLFGSEPKAILANPQVPAAGRRRRAARAARLHQDAGARASTGACARSGPATSSGSRRTGSRVARYWALEAREHTDDLATTIGTVRELLEDIVARQLISDVPLCTLLSGGLDSSAITALAARGTRGRRAPGRCAPSPWTSPATPTTSGPTRMRADPRRAVRARTGRARRRRAHRHRAGHDRADGPGHRAARPRGPAICRSASATCDTSLYLLFRAIRAHSTVALSGESADEVFGGYRWFHDPGAVAPTPSRGWRDRRRRRGRRPAAASLLDRGLLDELDLAGYQAPGYREALAEVPRLAGETGHERRMREICYLHLTRFVQILLDRKDRMSMAVGLEVRVPFCDHRLVEYVFNTPWAMKTFDGREKSLLRAATRTCCLSPWRSGSRAPTRAPRTRAMPTRCASS